MPADLQSKRSISLRYLFAVAVAAAAMAVRFAADPVIGVHSPYLPLLLGIIVAARFGGRGPGCVTTVLCAFASWYFFEEPRFSFTAPPLYGTAGLLLFMATGIIVSLLIGRVRETLESLEEKSSRLEELNKALNLAHAFVRSPDGIIIHWTRGAESLYGWSQQDAVGKSTHDLLRTAFPIPFEEIQKHLLTSGEWKGELRHRCRDGDTVVVASHWSLQRDEHGRPRAILEVNNDISAEKAADEALHRAHQERETYLCQLEAVLDCLAEGLIISDLKGNLFHWNPAALTMLGYTRPEDCPANLDELGAAFALSTTEGEFVPLEARPFARILRGETLRNLELIVRRRGTDWQRVFRYGGNLARDSNGTPLVAVESFHDVTEMKQAEENLRKNEAMLRSILDTAVDPVYLKDLDGRTILANPATHHTFGADATEGSGRPWQLIRENDRRVIEGGATLVLEETIPTPSGARVFLSAKSPWRDAHGRVIGLVGVSRDITDRKQAEEALRQSEQRFRSLFESMDEGFATCEVIYDERGRPIDVLNLMVNPAFGRLIGIPAEKVMGRTAREVIPDIEPHWIETAARIVQTGRSERICDRVSGVGKTFEGFGWRTGPGRLAYVFNDVTERMRAENEIRRLNEELEQRVRDRTAELEAANRELEAFSYSISHDLRAPLRGIDGWSLALAEDYGGQLDARAQQYLERVRSETRRMGTLIEDLLELSRLTRSDMRRQAVDLSMIAEDIAVRLIAANPSRRIEFQIDPGMTAHGDAGLLEAALTNLLGNAVKFTGPRDVGRIHFGLCEQKGAAAFFIRDNGVGFDMSYAGKLFGAFQRLHKASDFPGTGIGLATVQRIIHRHGGRVWADAGVDQGATFYFTIGR
jgi:PAS domain S-box-containing protein